MDDFLDYSEPLADREFNPLVTTLTFIKYRVTSKNSVGYTEKFYSHHLLQLSDIFFSSFSQRWIVVVAFDAKRIHDYGWLKLEKKYCVLFWTTLDKYFINFTQAHRSPC